MLDDERKHANDGEARGRTFVKTAMEAYELPKLMPTMGSVVDWSGDVALPFGIGPFSGIVGDVDDFFFCSLCISSMMDFLCC